METNPFIERMRSIVLKHYSDEQFGVKQLSQQIGISRSQLHRKLKSSTGQSVSQFIREIRLDESLKLLQHEDLSASEVSYKVGFNSPTYFNTCFHNYFGFTPGEVKHKFELAKANNVSVDIKALKKPSYSLYPFHKTLIPISIVMVIAVLLYFNFIEGKQNDNNEINQPIESIDKAPSIAVLPFKNYSGDEELEWVSDGISTDIISKLTIIDDLDWVVPWSSVLKYKDSLLTPADIKKKYEVSHVLEGTYRQVEGYIKFSVALIETENEKSIWIDDFALELGNSQNLDGDTKNIIQIQAEVAKQVADNLKLKLSKPELETIEYEQTANSEALNAYNRANYLRYKDGFYNSSKIIELYEKAIALDSSFFMPYISLADVYGAGAAIGSIKDRDEAHKKSRLYYELAKQRVNPKNKIEMRAFEEFKMAAAFYGGWDFKTVNEHLLDLENHLDRDGRIPFSKAFGFDYARKLGKYSLAIKIGEESGWDKEEGGGFFLGQAMVLVLAGQNEEALKILDEIRPIYTRNRFHLIESALMYYYLNDMEASKQQLEQFKKLDVSIGAPELFLLAAHAEMEGDTSLKNEYINTLQHFAETDGAVSPAWFLAMYYCHTKEYDKVFKWLEKSYELREVEMTWLKEEPLLRPLRNDPRYIELYNKVGFAEVVPNTPYIE